jgi:hypothetical protein
MLTPDCFKRICMRSRSSRAEDVRTYFIELESLLVRCRSTLLKGMDGVELVFKFRTDKHATTEACWKLMLT